MSNNDDDRGRLVPVGDIAIDVNAWRTSKG